jgi:S-adenosylmethionine decarboxylase
MALAIKEVVKELEAVETEAAMRFLEAVRRSEPRILGAGIIRHMIGLHLTADLHGCALAQPAMTDVQALRALCLGAVQAAGLTAVGELFHRFPPLPNASNDEPQGITGVVLLAESHVAVHTWPERAAVTLDVYVCNFEADNSARAEMLIAALLQGFAPAQVNRQTLLRGLPAQVAA